MYNHDDICHILKEKGMTLLDRYKGRTQKHIIRCYCNQIFEAKISSLLSGHRQSCGCKPRVNGLSLDELNDRLEEKGFQLAEPYKGSINRRHLIKCHCGKVREANLKQALRKHVTGCGCQRGPGVFEAFKIKKLPALLDKLKAMNIVLDDEYHGMWEKHKLICHCGKKFITSLNNLAYGHSKGCGCGIHKRKVQS